MVNAASIVTETAELTNIPSPPKRKRWRWLVLSLLLLSLSVVSWWFWPRGDARFVGRWKSDYSMQGFWEFRSNGVAVWNGGTLTSTMAYTTWRVKGNVLTLGEPQIRANQKWRAWVLDQWNNLPFTKWIVDSTSFRVLEIKQDTLSLASTDFQEADDALGAAEIEKLRRIPE
ncbi:hypothetical protein AYO47_06915 [Planctomyces sp. SCGC AG-212-M04]|nr:hypothetical protein AYO47_06915 [Planctomyces sp. SCGC AG-212-M04]